MNIFLLLSFFLTISVSEIQKPFYNVYSKEYVYIEKNNIIRNKQKLLKYNLIINVDNDIIKINKRNKIETYKVVKKTKNKNYLCLDENGEYVEFIFEKKYILVKTKKNNTLFNFY